MSKSPREECPTHKCRLRLAEPNRKTGHRRLYCPKCDGERATERKQAGIGWRSLPVLPRDPMTGYMAEQKRRIKGIES